VPQDDRVEIELAGILALAAGKKKPVQEGDGLQVTLVAGTRNHLDLLLSAMSRATGPPETRPRQ
jgi:hypothetical protein